jgi:hypothetical protein
MLNRGNLMTLPVKLTRDSRIVTAPNAPPLTGAQLLELGKRLLERGCVVTALETVDPGRLSRTRPAQRTAVQ